MIEDIHTYQSLDDIKTQKNIIKKDIAANEKNISRLWNNLFRKDTPKMAATPSYRISQIFTTGASVLDGLILGWKLYRRFKK